MLGRLRIGFIPIAGAEEPDAPVLELAAEIGRAVRVPADCHRAADYRSLVAALVGGAVHIAWVPPLVAARSVLEKRIVPVALAVRDGATSYSAALITRRSSPIRTPADLVDLRAAWVDRESASGYTVIRMALRALGVRLVEAFTTEVFARSHAEVARLVVSGKVDVGATYVNYLPDRSAIVRGGWSRVAGVSADDIRIVTESGLIPCDFIAVHPSLPPTLLESFTTALVDGRHARRVNEHAKKLLRADGFVRPTPSHFSIFSIPASVSVTLRVFASTT